LITKVFCFCPGGHPTTHPSICLTSSPCEGAAAPPLLTWGRFFFVMVFNCLVCFPCDVYVPPRAVPLIFFFFDLSQQPFARDFKTPRCIAPFPGKPLLFPAGSFFHSSRHQFNNTRGLQPSGSTVVFWWLIAQVISRLGHRRLISLATQSSRLLQYNLFQPARFHAITTPSTLSQSKFFWPSYV